MSDESDVLHAVAETLLEVDPGDTGHATMVLVSAVAALCHANADILEALDKLAQPGVFTEGTPPDQKPECKHIRHEARTDGYHVRNFCRDCGERLPSLHR